jgi:hypothetical protein
MLHVENLGVQFALKNQPKKKTPEKRIICCMLCNLLYNILKHKNGCPSCLRGDERLARLEL